MRLTIVSRAIQSLGMLCKPERRTTLLVIGLLIIVSLTIDLLIIVSLIIDLLFH